MTSPESNAFAAYRPPLPWAVHREDGHDHVEAKRLIRCFGLEADHALPQPALADAVDAINHGRPIGVAQDVGVGDGIELVGEPALAPGLVLVRFVEALEGEVFDLPPLVVDGLDLGACRGGGSWW